MATKVGIPLSKANCICALCESLGAKERGNMPSESMYPPKLATYKKETQIFQDVYLKISVARKQGRNSYPTPHIESCPQSSPSDRNILFKLFDILFSSIWEHRTTTREYEIGTFPLHPPLVAFPICYFIVRHVIVPYLQIKHKTNYHISQSKVSSRESKEIPQCVDNYTNAYTNQHYHCN